jgi:hypothetical protein
MDKNERLPVEAWLELRPEQRGLIACPEDGGNNFLRRATI